MFARMGYRTFMSGKWHNTEPSMLRAFIEGKSIFFGGMGDPYTLPVADVSADRQLTNKRKSGKHSVELFSDSIIEFLKAQKGADKPFLAYVAFNLPHDPRLAPKNYHEPYNAKKPPLPPNYLPQHPFNNGDLIGRDERLAPWPRTQEVVRQHLADYYSAITFLDAQVGRILAALKEAGLEENTIVVFASDHGLAIGSHGLFGKQNLYDCSMHAPLIFAGPGIPQGKQNDSLCYLLDIYPTLGELTGVKAPEGNEGKSLLAVMQGKGDSARKALFFAYRDIQRAVCDRRWHLIRYTQINKTQLFDLENDPHETRDLAGDATKARVIERLTSQLQMFQKGYGDTQPLTTDKPAPVEFDFSKVPPVKEKKKEESSALPGGTGSTSSAACGFALAESTSEREAASGESAHYCVASSTALNFRCSSRTRSSAGRLPSRS
jgi:arylsulfatase A-like enzyme